MASIPPKNEIDRLIRIQDYPAAFEHCLAVAETGVMPIIREYWRQYILQKRLLPLALSVLVRHRDASRLRTWQARLDDLTARQLFRSLGPEIGARLGDMLAGAILILNDDAISSPDSLLARIMDYTTITYGPIDSPRPQLLALQDLCQRLAGQERQALQIENVTVLGVERGDSAQGFVATLRLERLPAGQEQIFHDPIIMGLGHFSPDFLEALDLAWNYVRSSSEPFFTANDLRWSVERWDGNPIDEMRGNSLAAAFALGLCAMSRAISLDRGIAITAALDSSGSLRPVGGFNEKFWASLGPTAPALRTILIAADQASAGIARAGDIAGIELYHVRHLDEALEAASHLKREVITFLEQIRQKQELVPSYYPQNRLNTISKLFVPLKLSRLQENRPIRPANISPRPLAVNLTSAGATRTEAYPSDDQLLDWNGDIRPKLRRGIVLGAPGSGKSWLLRHEALSMLTRQLGQLSRQEISLSEIRLPGLIRLSDLARVLPADAAHWSAVQHGLLTIFARDYPLSDSLKPWLNRLIVQGNMVLLLDALDEVPRGQRRHLLKALRDFALNFPTTPMIITCRQSDYGDLPWPPADQEQEWALLLRPLSRGQQSDFIEAWFGQTPGLAGEFQERLPALGNIEEWLKSPLLLGLLCATYAQHGHIPLKRGQLYEICWNRFAQKIWKSNETYQADRRLEPRLECYQAIALALFERGEELFPVQDLWALAGRLLADLPMFHPLARQTPDELIRSLEEDGLISRVGPGPDSPYIFCQRMFQAYLAACHLARQTNWLSRLKKHFWFEPAWEELIITLAGQLDSPQTDRLLAAILGQRDDRFHTMLFLASRCLREAGPGSRFQTKIEDRLIQLLADENPEFRQQAATWLGQLGSRRAIAVLVARLRQEAESGQTEQTQNLLRLGDAVMGVDIYPTSLALQDCAAPGNIESLIALRHDRDPKVRRAVIWAMGEVKCQPGRTAILGLLESPGDEMRRDALGVLKRIGDEKCQEYLCQRAASWPRNDLLSAIAAIGAIGGAPAREFLRQGLAQAEAGLRIACMTALVRLPSDEAWPDIIAALKDRERSIRLMAIEALGRSGRLEHASHLISLFYETESTEQLAIIESLGHLGGAEAAEFLKQRRHDPDSTIHRAALAALARNGLIGSIESLIRQYGQSETPARLALIDILARSGDPAGLDYLQRHLADPDRAIQLAAIKALGRLRAEAALDRLLALADSAEPELAPAAIRAVGAIGQPRAEAPLSEMLKRRDIATTPALLEALGQLRSRAAGPLIIKNLRHPAPSIRQAAIVALAQIADPAAIRPLRKQRKKEAPPLSWSIEAALRQISLAHKIKIFWGWF